MLGSSEKRAKIVKAGIKSIGETRNSTRPFGEADATAAADSGADAAAFMRSPAIETYNR